jgi:hypothetical protein
MFGENILVIEELIILLLLIASVVAIISRQLRIPYTVGLVLIGLALTLLIKIEFEISPQIILALLVPPLVFEAAFHIRFDDLRRRRNGSLGNRVGASNCNGLWRAGIRYRPCSSHRFVPQSRRAAQIAGFARRRKPFQRRHSDCDVWADADYRA